MQRIPELDWLTNVYGNDPSAAADYQVPALAHVPDKSLCVHLKKAGKESNLGFYTIRCRNNQKHSYGFRPGRSAHQAVAQAQRYVAEHENGERHE